MFYVILKQILKGVFIKNLVMSVQSHIEHLLMVNSVMSQKKNIVYLQIMGGGTGIK